MTTTKEKDPKGMSLEEYQGKWVNVWFKNSGESKQGKNIFKTEEDALAYSKKFFSGNFIGVRFSNHNMIWLAIEISHAIQMPVGE